MKLVSFSYFDTRSFGILKKNEVICLPKLAEMQKRQFPSFLETLISEGLDETEVALLPQNATNKALEKTTLSVEDANIVAPLVDPPKILCLGLNYKDHAAEQSKTPSNEPIIFMKPHTTIIGPNENIVKPNFVKQLDYEAELAIIIGKKAKNISIDDAKSHIFGYTILNDVSSRDIQFKDKQWTRGKSFDTFAPLGPCIATVNQIPDPTKLRIRTWINKELRQDSNTQNMALNVFEIVHHLSRVMTLEPCDIIATGTPAGVGFAMKPTPEFLEDGDVIEIEIENIGVLRNQVVEERPDLPNV